MWAIKCATKQLRWMKNEKTKKSKSFLYHFCCNSGVCDFKVTLSVVVGRRAVRPSSIGYCLHNINHSHAAMTILLQSVSVYARNTLDLLGIVTDPCLVRFLSIYRNVRATCHAINPLLAKVPISLAACHPPPRDGDKVAEATAGLDGWTDGWWRRDDTLCGWISLCANYFRRRLHEYFS